MKENGGSGDILSGITLVWLPKKLDFKFFIPDSITAPISELGLGYTTGINYSVSLP
jgi:hypothetical protein